MESHQQTVYLVVTALLRRDAEVLLVSQQARDDDRAYWVLSGAAIQRALDACVKSNATGRAVRV